MTDKQKLLLGAYHLRQVLCHPFSDAGNLSRACVMKRRVGHGDHTAEICVQES